MDLTSITFAYPEVDASRRASLSLSGEALDDARERLLQSDLDVFVLSTCLRIEIAVPGDAHTAQTALGSLFGDDLLWEQGTVRHGEEAFVHLCRVAAGLESPITGESEVLAQFRQAVEAQSLPSSPGALKPVLERAVGVARSVRRLLGNPPQGSMGAVAAREAGSSDEVAILGAGSMARAAVRELSSRNVAVYARRSTIVEDRPTRPWAEVAEAFSFPVVISAVPGGDESVPMGDVDRVLKRRESEVILVDLGMPPLPDSLCGHDAVRYLGIDALAARAQSSVRPEVDEALFTEAGKVWRRLGADDRVGLVISQLMDRAEATVSDEVRRFAHRVAIADDPEPVLRQLASRVARRILHDPISYVSTSGQADAVRVVAEAFGVEE